MSKTLSRSFTLLAITAAGMALLLTFLPSAGHDQLWFLLMARRWLAGSPLYGPEIFDSNPPMVIWLSAVPILLGRLLHLPSPAVAKALALLLACAVGLFSLRLLPRAWRPVPRSESPALAFAFTILFFVVPARDFGQRDALAAFLVLPYVLLASPSIRNTARPHQLLSGTLLAALAFCLKPQDALIAVSVECAALALTRRNSPSWSAALRSAFRRPEPLVLLGCGALYLLAIWRFAPLYFTQALPIVRATYWAIGHLSLPALLWQAIELTVLAGGTLAVAFRSSQLADTVRLLLAAAAGALVAYLLQGTGWYYQQLPAISLFGAALTLHLLDLQKRHPLHPSQAIPAGIAPICVLALALTAHFSGYPFAPDRALSITSPDPALFLNLPPGTPVAILTTSVDEAIMPIERFHLTWAQRTDNLWLLPAILRSEDPVPAGPPQRHLSSARLAWLEDLQHRWMVEDLKRWRPDLILVERCNDPALQCQELEDRHDDLLAWFKRDRAFAALWSQYRPAETRGRFDAYIHR